MRDIPDEVIASWPPANYIDPETRGHAVVIVNIVLMSLVTFVVFLRLYVRVYLLRWFGIDDLFIIIALITTAGFTACIVLANVRFGWSRHIWDIPPSKIPSALKIGWATKMLYSVAACFTRQSLLLFYYRLVQDGNMKRFRRVIHVASIYSVLTMFLLVLFTLIQCDPIRAFWVWPRMPKSHCWHDGILTVGCGIANTVADLMVTIIPIPLIARLELPKRRRIYAFIFVGTGFLACAAGAARAFYTWRSLVSSYDQTWESYGMFLSAAIEIDLGVICACVPALRILLVRFASSATCVNSSISSHLSHTTPLGSRATKHSGDMGSFSDGTLSSPTKGGVTEMIAKVPGVTTGPNSTCVPAVASASMKNAGFIMTRGLSTLTTSKDGTPLQYMWDEPWSGDNAPKAMIESKIDEEDPDKIDFDNASITPISAKTARRISLTPFRANTIQVSTPASTTRPPNSNGIATFVAQQAGIGILPDAASSGKSLGPESLGESDDLGLPIQGTPVDESHAETIRSYGSHTETNRSYETQTENRFSWLRFDLDSPKDWDRPQTGDAASSWQKSSWTDYQSPEDLDDERRKDPEEKDLVGVKAKQRAVKPLIMEKRSEELGWDLESNRVELREKW